MMRLVPLVRVVVCSVVLYSLAASPSAIAGEVSVGQAHQKFSEDAVSIKAGDSIKFVNDDNVAHNVMSAGPGGSKNAGLQKAGDSTTILYDKAGEYRVHCGIHPKMKMTVKVD
ncbi:MAG: cupredoxin domain-containing protein [Proteobacteria bacterium]|nr:cupredoxin domain-containing protein [Pseudomonadota bacterium]